MKKDKEWLKNEIEIMGSETSENYPHEQMVGREEVLNLIDQLYELNRPLVVPKDLGEWLGCQKLGNEGSLFSIIIELEDMWLECGFEEFVTDNKKQLIEVILGNRGYEVEQEKLYYVLDKQSKTLLVLMSGEVRISGGYVLSESTANKEIYQLTEKQIKDYDERFWEFAVEVTE